MKSWPLHKTSHQFAGKLATLLTLAILIFNQNFQLQVHIITLVGMRLFTATILPEITVALLIFLALIGVNAAPLEVIFSGFAADGF
ncbi:MAG: hypothetical protein P8M25_06845, partial [Paracoccaceae bacterium]|nr:hypothetical protein [Paracoccaceae bacterium]